MAEDYGEEERERLQEELSSVKRRFSHNKVKRKWVSDIYWICVLAEKRFFLQDSQYVKLLSYSLLHCSTLQQRDKKETKIPKNREIGEI